MDISIENRLKVLTHYFSGCRRFNDIFKWQLKWNSKKKNQNGEFMEMYKSLANYVLVYARVLIRFNIEKQKVGFPTFISKQQRERDWQKNTNVAFYHK